MRCMAASLFLLLKGFSSSLSTNVTHTLMQYPISICWYFLTRGSLRCTACGVFLSLKPCSYDIRTGFCMFQKGLAAVIQPWVTNEFLLPTGIRHISQALNIAIVLNKINVRNNIPFFCIQSFRSQPNKEHDILSSSIMWCLLWVILGRTGVTSFLP